MSMSPVMFACLMTIVGVLGACWLGNRKNVFIDCIAGILVFIVVVCVLLRFIAL